MFSALLAKHSRDPENPQDAETLPGHLELVLRTARTLLAQRGTAVLEMLGLAPEPWQRVLEWSVLAAAAVHDLGKANTQFQYVVRGKGDKQTYRHEVLTALILHQQPALDDWLFSGKPPQARALALRAVCGHHLRFGDQSLEPRPQGEVKLRLLLDHAHVAEALRRASALLDLPQEPRLKALDLDLATKPARKLKLWLHNALDEFWTCDEVRRCAGAVLALLVAADICASAVVSQGRDPAEWAHTLLEKCLEEGELDRIVKRHLKKGQLRPFQAQVESAPTRLTLVVAGCGTGKTVAAYAWARRRATGRRLFFCYPTTGTATEGFTSYAFPDLADEAALVHSRASYDLTELRRSDDAQNAVEHAWNGLMPWKSRLTVGTVDAVLGLLQHARTGLTAFPALAGAAFVFDEVHLYDDRLFGTLLRFLSTCRNAPVLLMTASLQPSRRRSLEQLAQELCEPLTTVSGPPELETLPRYLIAQADDETAIKAVEKALLSGKRVLWITNTVERATKFAQDAHKRGWPVKLYHSRFRYQDRMKRHREIVGAFSRDRQSGPVMAVTTQVCEVSLDISADLLVTEEAPPAAVIQRLGRLNRWAEPGRGHEPGLALVIQPPDSAPYKAEELDECRRWLQRLVGRPVSQQDLHRAFEELTSSTPMSPAEVAWLDDMIWICQRQLREPGTTIDVLREEDLPQCKSRDDAVGNAIPMLVGPVQHQIGGWPRCFGIPVAPKGTIVYDEKWGARWST